MYNISKGRNTRSGVPYQNQVGAKKSGQPFLGLVIFLLSVAKTLATSVMR